MRFGRRKAAEAAALEAKALKLKRRRTETTISGLDLTEKRIGQRQQIPSLPIVWCSDRGPVATEAEVQADPHGHIVELSASGAGILGNPRPELEIDLPVSIGCLGMRTEVVLKRIDTEYSPYHWYFGVEFAEPGAPLTRSLYGQFQARAEPLPEDYVPRDWRGPGLY